MKKEIPMDLKPLQDALVVAIRRAHPEHATPAALALEIVESGLYVLHDGRVLPVGAAERFDARRRWPVLADHLEANVIFPQGERVATPVEVAEQKLRALGLSLDALSGGDDENDDSPYYAALSEARR
jgi:hypothetical protein